MRELAFDTANAVPAPGTVLTEARDLSFSARGRVLIDSVDLSALCGQVTVIMGANGAGKSLLLRLMHGLIAPTGGTIRWRGNPLDRAARLKQAMVFQRPVLLRRSAAANLRFALAVRGVRRAERAKREAEALDRARLAHVAGRPARVLSGGEQQRLALARALVCEPELLFLDEPTASLDPGSTRAFEALVTEAKAAGVTVVLVTHDPGQARRLGDRLVFLQAGRVAETGDVTEVLDNPRSVAVRDWRDGRI